MIKKALKLPLQILEAHFFLIIYYVSYKIFVWSKGRVVRHNSKILIGYDKYLFFTIEDIDLIRPHILSKLFLIASFRIFKTKRDSSFYEKVKERTDEENQKKLEAQEKNRLEQKEKRKQKSQERKKLKLVKKD